MGSALEPSRPSRPGRRPQAVTSAMTVIAASLFGLVSSTPASAAPPVPTASLNFLGGTSPLLGETLTFEVGFDNTDSTASGYMPYFDLYLPIAGADGDDGIAFTSASYLGAPISSALNQTCSGSAVVHPLTGVATSCPAGQQLVVLRLPFGSFTPAQPSAPITVTAALSILADVATPLAVAATGGFAFGDSPTGSTPIVGPTASANLVPNVVRFTKRYVGPEHETAAGPSFPRQHTLAVDVADGSTLTVLDVNDSLPSTMQYLSSSSAPATR